ncbi:Homoserine kinase [subsurface metagenome]
MVKYWVASHITGFFSIHDEHTNPLFKGSRGAGFSLSRGVYTEVNYSDNHKHHIFFNGQERALGEARVTNSVLCQILEIIQERSPIDFGITINHNFEIPMSSGYGSSASGALGASYALNELLDLNLSKEEIFGIAHKTEVAESSGLGDVIALYAGGWEYRLKEGAPTIGATASMILDDTYKIATISFGELKTSSIIRDKQWKKRVNLAGKECLSNFIKKPTVENFAKQSYEFSVKSKLASKDIIDFYDQTKDNVFLKGQIMLGNGVFILYKNDSDIKNIEGLKKETICEKTIVKAN